MSTSLAAQLQRLAVPQTNLLKRVKKRASLLFDPKEAAGLKRDTVYHIGLEGLEELISRNRIFEQFQDTLFHVASKDYERSVQNEEANRLLNKHVKTFLLLLSPYFLLNCSHKALEWLIYRYMINEYNKDELLMLILPYHESNIFVRLLQLLYFKDQNDPWYFLKPLQKSGLHLPKQSLLNFASSNTSFLKFVTRYILQLIKCHEKPNLLTVAFNFYCSMFCGAIEYSDEVTEDQVSQMLPLLLKGLKSDIPDFCAASYVVVARLVAKSSLSHKLLHKFVEEVTQIKTQSLKTEACLVLIVIYQSQKEYQNMPPDAIANLSEKEWFPKILQELNVSGSFIYPFLEVVVKRATEEGVNNDLKLSRDLVKNILDEIKFDQFFVATFLSCFLGVLKPKMKYTDTIKEWLTEIIQTLEKQYPDAFDKEVYKIFSAGSDIQLVKQKKCLQKILQNSMTFKGKFDIFDKLYHPHKEFRGAALNYLRDNYNSLKDTEKEIIRNCFVDRLNDDNASVVKETLKVVSSTSVLNKELLYDILSKLSRKCLIMKDNNDWNNIKNSVLSLLCESNDFTWEIFLVIFPYLLPKSQLALNEAKSILKMPFLNNCELLNTHMEELLQSDNPELFTKLLFECLECNGSLHYVKDFVNALKKDKVTGPLHSYTASLILTSILPKSLSLETSSIVLEVLIKFYKDAIVKSTKTKPGVTGYVETALKNKFPLPGYLHCTEMLIKKTERFESNLGKTDLSEGNLSNMYFVLLASLLLRNTSLSRRVLNTFLNHFCEGLPNKTEFLLNLCISENSNFDKNCIIGALSYLLRALKNVSDVNPFIFKNNYITIYLTILLANADQEIRTKCLSVIEKLLSDSPKKVDTFCCLLEGLLKHKEELIIDCEQIALVIFNILAPQNTKGKKNVRDLNSIRNNLFRIINDQHSPLYVKSNLLKILSLINTFQIFEETSKLVVEILENKPQIISGFNSVICIQNLERIEEKILSKLTIESNIWKLIEFALKSDKTVIEIDDRNKSSLTALMLNKLTRGVFEVLEENVTKHILDIICEVSTLTQNPEVLPAANRVFKHIDVDANLILDHLTKMRDIRSTKQTKRRVSSIPTVDILDTLDWKKGVTILEFIQDKKKIRNTNSLLPVLFEVLKKCLDFDEQAAVEYPKQLILSLILLCCTKIDKETLTENMFHMELIVQCIRASQNPQTHHHALLVLVHTAQLVPHQVLHHVMAIFTFMGSSLVRHDDAYSFQIIAKIIDTVVPILVEDNQVPNIGNVLRVFVDALLDIPEHRRIPLYKQLLNRIGVEENMYLFLLLVFESHVLHSNQSKRKSNKNNVELAASKLDIAANLCRKFSHEIVISSCIKLLEHLRNLPDEKENVEVDVESITFNIATHTPIQFRHYKYTIVTFISSLLSSKEFVNQIACLSEDEIPMLEELYKNIIISILTYIRRASKVAEKTSKTPHAHYWKLILHYSYDILDSVNALLTPQMFLLVIKGLMVHNLRTVKRRALELLNTKLQHNRDYFKDCVKNEIYALIPPIVSIIETINKEQLESDQELLIQTALLSLKLLSKYFAREDPEKIVQLLQFVTSLLKLNTAHNNVLASIILCLAELCVDLRAYAISYLAEFMKPFLKILKMQKCQETSSLLLLSVITAVQKLLESLPLFLSPYLDRILFEISILISKWGYNTQDSKLQPYVNKLTNIKQKLGSVIPSRVLIPAVEHSYNSLIEKKYFNAVKALMDILSESLKNLNGPDVNANLPELTNFFLKALQFRSDGVSTFEEANIVEEHVIKALTVLVFKLSESSFRPLYYKFYDWAVRNEEKSERLITFYNLSSNVAESLKGLFVLFAGHFINNSAQTLDAINRCKSEKMYFDDESKDILLLESILKTLSSIFMYDNQKFVNKDRFEVLMQPLVDQLENVLGDIEQTAKRNKDLLTPCLVHFALVVADDALWKQMNYQILLKMRSNFPHIRLMTLHCLTEIVTKLGEDFLPLLPETIPFLAELLEDEDEAVEKSCQKAVQEMEKVLGEPLQKYF